MCTYSFPLRFIPWCWISFSVLCSRTLLFIYSGCTSLPLLISNFQSIPSLAPSPLATASLFSHTLLFGKQSKLVLSLFFLHASPDWVSALQGKSGPWATSFPSSSDHQWGGEGWGEGREEREENQAPSTATIWAGQAARPCGSWEHRYCCEDVWSPREVCSNSLKLWTGLGLRTMEQRVVFSCKVAPSTDTHQIALLFLLPWWTGGDFIMTCIWRQHSQK